MPILHILKAFRSRIFMIRWRLLGLNASPTAVIHRRVTIIRPSRITMGPHAGIGLGSHIKCVPGTVRLDERAWVGEGGWISSTNSVHIEKGAMIGPSCHITDANHGFEGAAAVRDQGRIASPVLIGEGAWLGAGVKVLAGVTVGKGAVIGAGSVVTRDIPDYGVAAGVPARVLRYRDHDTATHQATDSAP